MIVNQPFKSLLPDNNQTNVMLALEEVSRTFEQLPAIELKNFWNPNLCRVDLLPFLAQQLGVINWDNSWEEAQKRQVCQNAILVSKHKGTIGALKRALQALNLSTEVKEWWQVETPKDPMTAEVILHEQDIIYDRNQFNVILKLISEVKRLAVHLTLTKKIPINDALYIGGSFNQVLRMTIKND